jgi:hypothetical protein
MSTGICANPALRGHHSVTTILIAGSCVATASKKPSILAQSALIENGDERLTRYVLRNGNTGKRDAHLCLSRWFFQACFMLQWFP